MRKALQAFFNFFLLKKRRIEIARIHDSFRLKNTTKTGLIRHIPINSAAFEVLAKLFRNKTHSKLVFSRENGQPLNTNHISNRPFKKAVERAGVRKIRFHDLRTTYASNFVMSGGDIFALSKLLGHTSVEMTAKKYAALHPRFMKEVAETVCFNGDSTTVLAPVK